MNQYSTKSETKRGVEHYVLYDGEKRLFSMSPPFYKGTKRNFDALATRLNKQAKQLNQQAARIAALEQQNAGFKAALQSVLDDVEIHMQYEQVRDPFLVKLANRVDQALAGGSEPAAP